MNLFKKSLKKLSDEELMDSIVSGNQSSFEELYDRYSKSLHFFFYRMLGNNEEMANDFLQDLFVKIIEKPKHFNSNMKFSTWVYTVATNMCKNQYRKAGIRKMISDEVDLSNYYFEQETISETYDNDLFHHCLFRELEDLNPDFKLIFLLRFQQELTIKEISEITECPEGTVKSRLFYIVRKLSGRLKVFDPKYYKI